MSPIDREALVADIQACAKGDCDSLGVHEILCIIDQQPPLNFSGLGFQSRWEPFDDCSGETLELSDYEGSTHWACSSCEETLAFVEPVEEKYLPNFCPRCGARMRGVLHP